MKAEKIIWSIGRNEMRVGDYARFAFAILTVIIFVTEAQAQVGPCINDLPNSYRQVGGWAPRTPRALGEGNSIFVDSKDNLWLADRCGTNCIGSNAAPIWELSSDGSVLKNFGAGLFIFPHGIAVDKDGNIWAVDRDIKDGMGAQVIKFSPDGKVLMRLGKAGQSGAALDQFSRPASVTIAPNGDIFVGDGHRSGDEGQPQTFGNGRIMKFDKNGKFIKTFGRLGTGDGELMQPHGLAFDSQGRLFVADRSTNRIEIFDQDGKFIATWKQFGRPSGLWIDKNDTLYVTDSQSEATTAKLSMYYPPNPGCKHGIRIGSAKTGKVQYYIPHPKLAPEATKSLRLPLPSDLTDIEGIAVDSHGTIYAQAVTAKTIYKYVKK
jgi:DNA-binding beta-propeller fold protein YncE